MNVFHNFYHLFPFFQSNGDLENDERIGGIVIKMLKLAQKHELGLTEDKEGFQRLTSAIYYFNFQLR